MDISGAQLNSAAISAYNTQLQEAPRQDRQQEAAPAGQQSSSAEVSLSSDARNRAEQDTQSPPVQPPSGSQDNTPTEQALARQDVDRPQEQTPEDRASQAREAEANRQQSPEASSSSYSARLAVQNYSSVANF
jgi:hypothetical protein